MPSFSIPSCDLSRDGGSVRSTGPDLVFIVWERELFGGPSNDRGQDAESSSQLSSSSRRIVITNYVHRRRAGNILRRMTEQGINTRSPEYERWMVCDPAGHRVNVLWCLMKGFCPQLRHRGALADLSLPVRGPAMPHAPVRIWAEASYETFYEFLGFVSSGQARIPRNELG
jgi:hypothetical protein